MVKTRGIYTHKNVKGVKNCKTCIPYPVTFECNKQMNDPYLFKFQTFYTTNFKIKKAK